MKKRFIVFLLLIFCCLVGSRPAYCATADSAAVKQTTQPAAGDANPPALQIAVLTKTKELYKQQIDSKNILLHKLSGQKKFHMGLIVLLLCFILYQRLQLIKLQRKTT